MIIINTSEVISDLLPEVCHAFDPDLPYFEVGLSRMIQQHFRDMIMHAFYQSLCPDQYYDSDWLARLKTDRFLSALDEKRWIDIQIVDIDGTYVLIFEE